LDTSKIFVQDVDVDDHRNVVDGSNPWCGFQENIVEIRISSIKLWCGLRKEIWITNFWNGIINDKCNDDLLNEKVSQDCNKKNRRILRHLKAAHKLKCIYNRLQMLFIVEWFD